MPPEPDLSNVAAAEAEPTEGIITDTRRQRDRSRDEPREPPVDALPPAWRRWAGASGLLALLAPGHAIAEERVCHVRLAAMTAEEALRECRAGDIISALAPISQGSGLGLAAQVCDFGRQIMVERHPEGSFMVIACVYNGSVRKPLPASE